jgi:DNA mismatch repair protein MSH6
MQPFCKNFNNGTLNVFNIFSKGKIIPRPGINNEYDNAIDRLNENQKKFELYLKQQAKSLNCHLKYFGSNKNRYQLEIPDEKCKNLTTDYELTSSKKGFKR